MITRKVGVKGAEAEGGALEEGEGGGGGGEEAGEEGDAGEVGKGVEVGAVDFGRARHSSSQPRQANQISTEEWHVTERLCS